MIEDGSFAVSSCSALILIVANARFRIKEQAAVVSYAKLRTECLEYYSLVEINDRVMKCGKELMCFSVDSEPFLLLILIPVNLKRINLELSRHIDRITLP